MFKKLYSCIIHVVRKEFSESCCRRRIVFLHSVKTYVVSKEDILNMVTADIPIPSSGHGLYADNITITSTHTITSAAKKYMQPYLHTVFAWTN